MALFSANSASDPSGILLPLHASHIAKLARRYLQKRFDAGSGRWLQTRLGLNCQRDALRQGLSRLQGHVQTPRKETFQHLQISARQSGHAVIRQRECGVWLRGRIRWRKDVGREGSCVLAAGGRLLDAISNDQGSGGQIAKPLMVLSDKDRDRPDCVKEGNLVHVADEVARHRLEESDGPSRSFDYSDSRDSLSGCAAVPEGLEDREVSPVEEEDQEEVNRKGPLFGKLVESAQAREEVCEYTANNEDSRYPDQVVNQQGDEAAADTGNGHLYGDEFRRFNAKLI